MARASSTTRFTVLITAYNHDKYIEQSIKSVLGQRVPPDRIIAFSDGSSDNTLESMKGLLGHDSRVEWLPDLERNLGLMPRMVQASKRLEHEYLVVVSGDDVLDECAIEVYRDALADTGAEWCIARSQLTDETLTPTVLSADPAAIPPKRLFRSMLRLDPWFPASSWCYSADLLRRVGGYFADYIAEDYSLGVRFARAATPAVSSRVTAYWRRFPNELHKHRDERMWLDHARVALSQRRAAPVDACIAASRHFEAAASVATGSGHYARAAWHVVRAIAVWPAPDRIMTISRLAGSSLLRRSTGKRRQSP